MSEDRASGPGSAPRSLPVGRAVRSADRRTPRAHSRHLAQPPPTGRHALVPSTRPRFLPDPATCDGSRHEARRKDRPRDGRLPCIGRGIALAFAREGADVAINYRRDEDAARATADEVRALGRRAEVHRADVADPEAMARMFEAAAKSLGGFDVVVANSGVASRTATVVDTDYDYWKRVVDVDLNGVFLTCKLGVPHLRERGNVIVVSSIGADLCAPFGAPYYVAKAGANALVKVLAKELAPAKKRVNCIAPGMIATDMG
ncbi:MAG: SDR family NAD(P)-dependent oxidoreductase, partial [Alphaproteobacteria bacterium]